MGHAQTITKFYQAFAAGDYQGMIDCYHPDIKFRDPAFGELSGTRACKMWEMLLTSSNQSPKVTYTNVQAEGGNGSANWRAEYLFGPKSNPVINEISAQFKFKDDKIIEHVDHFDLWKWSRQALGPVGYLLGWSPLIKNKVQKMANGRLEKFMST